MNSRYITLYRSNVLVQQRMHKVDLKSDFYASKKIDFK